MGKDLKWFMKVLEEKGELHKIDQEVDWNMEAMAFEAIRWRAGDYRAAHYRKLKGYPEGYGLLGRPFVSSWRRPWRRYAMAFGWPQVTWRETLGFFAKAIVSPIKPVMVATGPVKKEVATGPDANLFKYPWPYFCEGTGGRYSVMNDVIQKDPDSEWINWGNYRVMMLSRNKLTIAMQPGQQGANLLYYKYEPRNIPMPTCISVGGDPACFVAGGLYLPPGMNEVDVAGGLRGEPIELTKGETVDLPVPASAEIVIEGFIRPFERGDEGPWGEYLGYIHGPRRLSPLLRVTAVCNREEPTIPTCLAGDMMDEAHVMCTLFSAGLYLHLSAVRKWPVTSAYMNPAYTQWDAVLVATEVPYPGYVQDLCHYVFCLGPTVYCDFMFVFDADVNLEDVTEYLEELFLKTDPAKDWHNLGKLYGPRSHLNVFMTPEEKEKNPVTSKIYVDATTKGWDETKKGPKRFTVKTLYPEDIQKKVEEKWAELGLKDEDFEALKEGKLTY